MDKAERIVRRFTLEEKLSIKKYIIEGHSNYKISKLLNRAKSSISSEISSWGGRAFYVLVDDNKLNKVTSLSFEVKNLKVIVDSLIDQIETLKMHIEILCDKIMEKNGN